MTGKFTPTTTRGKELRHLVLERIEREVEKAGKGPDVTYAGAWDQHRWGELDPDKLREFGIPDKVSRVAVPPEVAAECGTSFCFAGHTLVMVGDRLLLDGSTPAWATSRLVFNVEPFDSDEPMGIRPRATQLLELTVDQADVLFDEENTLTDIREILARIDDGEAFFRCSGCGEYEWQCECGYQYFGESEGESR